MHIIRIVPYGATRRRIPLLGAHIETFMIQSWEQEKLEYLLRTKKWNPYCICHSPITSDSDFLPEYAATSFITCTAKGLISPDGSAPL
jgi:hypothetical protein